MSLTKRSPGPHRLAAGLGVAAVLIVALLVSMFVNSGSTGREQGIAVTTSPSRTVTPTPITTAATTPARTSSAATSTAATSSTLTGLIAQAPSGGVSISAVNTVTGRKITLGAGRGMLEASVSKIALLEILLLERQRQGRLLTDDEDDQLTQMIEHSSNDAANDVFDLAGGHDTVVAEQVPLGLDTSITVYGPGNLWGLTTSSAAQQIILLRNLVDDDSPLNAKSREYAMDLLTHVESDQRWGVPVAADPGSTYAVKNGWLAVDGDHGLWAVNTDGIITVHGQQLLVSVMTQHDASFAGGIAYGEQLVRAAVAAIT